MATYDLIPTHPTYTKAQLTWTRIRDALAGERTVKAKGVVYLPALDGQEPDEYAAYLERAVFFNASKRTLESLSGRLFKRAPQVLNAPPSFSLKNISKDGQSFLSFARATAEEVLSLSRFGILVDKPGRAPDGSSGPAFFVGYKAEDIINWRTRNIRGRKVLDQVILREYYDEPGANGLGSGSKVRYRVLELNESGVYQQRVYELKNGAKRLPTVEPIIPVKNGKPLTEIPFRIVSPKMRGPEIEKPALEDIVELNFSHYRSYADLEHGRHYTAMPTYYITGAAGDSTEFTIGPARAWKLSENDKVGLLEFNGSGLQFLENALEGKEQQIASLGGRLLSSRRRVAAESSASAEQREEGEQGILLSVCASLEEVFSDLLTFKAQWDGYDVEIVAEFNKDFSERDLSSRDMRVLQQLAESGMPNEILYRSYRAADAVRPDMSLEDFSAMMDSFKSELRAQKMEEMRAKAPAPQPQPKSKGQKDA